MSWKRSVGYVALNDSQLDANDLRLFRLRPHENVDKEKVLCGRTNEQRLKESVLTDLYFKL